MDPASRTTSSGPDFLGIGAQKSGTTWLHQMLGRHPEIWLPPEKELHFLDERRHSSEGPLRRLRGDSASAERWRRQLRRQWKSVRNGEASLSTVLWYARYFGRKADLSWYRSLFRAAGDRVSGEITPNYSRLSAEDVRWAGEALGDTKIIFLVRNPIERVWSHAQMVQRAQRRPASSAIDELLENRAFRALSDYAETIRNWSSTFGEDSFFLGQMEDIAFSPDRLVDAVCDFLEVSRPSSHPGAGKAVHRGGHSTMDLDVAVKLAWHFHADLERLAAAYAGWTRWWLFAAEELLHRPPAGPLEYPLWQSELWDRWSSSGSHAATVSLSSGPLSPVASRTES